MQQIAAFVMAGRGQAVMTAVGLMALGLILPPIALLSGAVVGLVALRVGLQQALITTALGALALGLIALLTGVGLVQGAALGLSQWLPVVALAWVLRRTESWTRTLQAAIGFGLGMVLIVHASTDDVVGLWRTALAPVLEAMGEGAGISGPEFEQAMDTALQLATGTFAAGMVIVLALTLFVARHWQALLYNPGGFGREFADLRVGLIPGVAGVALIFGGATAQSMIMIEFGLVFLAANLLQGVALVHGLARRLNWHLGWLVGMYALLVLAFPYMVTMLLVLGVMDALVDLRRKVDQRASGPEE
jgi:hypothetical protein